MAEFLRTRVSTFDDLIAKKGIERGNTILISGGCGVGKTIFTTQSIYYGALEGEKGVLISLGEDEDKLKRHMKSNFNWDLNALEERGLLSIQKVDPFALAEDVTSMLESQEKKSTIDVGLFEGEGRISLVDSRKVKLPFKPDRIVLDSISALESAFTNDEYYRICIQALVDALNQHNSVNFIISETEQEPNTYSKTGTEEFLVDGVIVLYNLRRGQLRRQALEILKLRCSNHIKEMVSYMITDEGIRIMAGELVV
jgi:circadian clock protein KaiC